MKNILRPYWTYFNCINPGQRDFDYLSVIYEIWIWTEENYQNKSAAAWHWRNIY